MLSIRAVVFRDGEQWVAQCLEHDIGAQAPDIDLLRLRLRAMLIAELNESLHRKGAPFAGIDPAPAHYHDMWDRRAKSFESTPVEVGDKTEVQMALVA